ncbi:MAG: TIM barrel protein [Gammaproteobacteria bacterium]|nr:TIM barrel protein [Gammaproteobacteria bacterium]
MKNLTRRKMLSKSIALGVGVSSISLIEDSTLYAIPKAEKDDISIAQWALVREIRQGEWTTLEFPQIARETFGINGIEFVSTLFELPTFSYLKKLSNNAAKHDVKMVLIMVDDEGETCSPDKEERIQAAINHRKWVDIAKFLNCNAIRTNCRGPRNAPKKKALEWAADTYKRLLDYAAPMGIRVCIENHGGLSDDVDWMVDLFKRVNHPFFGSYPDWREPSSRFDNYRYLQKMLPYAVGMSYRNQPKEEESARMIKLCRDSGYRGWYGIESSGRDAIRQGKELLKKYLEI